MDVAGGLLGSEHVLQFRGVPDKPRELAFGALSTDRRFPARRRIDSHFTASRVLLAYGNLQRLFPNGMRLRLAVLAFGGFYGYAAIPNDYPCWWERGHWVDQLYGDKYGNTTTIREWVPGQWMCL